MSDVREDRSRTVAMLKRWDLWPLDARHKPGPCACPACFEGSPALVEPLRARRKPKAFFWEEDAA